MRRKVLISAILVLLLGVILSAPFVELVDHWDNFPQSGNDTILSIVCFLVIAGIAFVLVRSSSTPETKTLPQTSFASLQYVPSLNPHSLLCSPPLSLRI